MVHIYTANSGHFRNNHDLNALVSVFPKTFQERAFRYQSTEAAYNFAVGRLLIKHSIEQMGIPFHYEDIQISENAKPFYKGVAFNLSHSGDVVACAISKQGKLGLDLEEIKDIDWKTFKSWFTESEWDSILNADDSRLKFYQYWCRKESIIKALGLKLSFLNQIELDIERNEIVIAGEQLFLREVDLGGKYVGVVCGNFEIGDMCQESVSLIGLN